MKILRIDGKLMQVGVFDTAFEFNPVTITTKNLRVIGCLGGDYAASMQLLGTGEIDANQFISHVFPLSGISEAFETQADTGVSIKVMIKP
jgi:threonine dehydrogenase-like Zn-dependent dehydrogenase